MGCYYYPRTVSHVLETLRGQGAERQTVPLLGLGRVYARRTQKACGTAMRLCASLSRGVAAPLGCVIFSVSVGIAACMPCPPGLSVCARRGVVSLPSAYSACCRNARCPLVKTTNLSFPHGQARVALCATSIFLRIRECFRIEDYNLG